jgi:hypothetical protein
MQSQDYAMPFRHHADLHHSVDTDPLLSNGMYQPMLDPHHYFAPDRLTLNHTRFSRGSSLVHPYQESRRYFPDTRGQDAAAIAVSSGLAGSSATGLGIAGGTVAVSGSNDFFRLPDPEGLTDYRYEQQWQWPDTSESLHGVTFAAGPVSSSSRNTAPEFAMNKSTLNAIAFTSEVLQPAAQLPTPASMAVLLNHNNSRSEMRTPQAQQELANGVRRGDGSATTRPALPDVHADVVLAETMLESPPSREKKHGCTMCHKRLVAVSRTWYDTLTDSVHDCRFDRPSTLRKVGTKYKVSSNEGSDDFRLVASACPHRRKGFV